MSDANAPLEGMDAGTDPTGAIEPGVEQSELDAQQQVEYLDVDDDLGNRHVRIKVDGEEISVPLREALSGYSRTADYTQKTQQIAEQRRQAEEAIALHQAMTAAPGLTVQILASRAGVSVEEYLGMTPAQQQAATQQTYDDPLEAALAEEREARLNLEKRFAQQEADQLLREQVNGLKQRFQLDDNQVKEVVAVAFQQGLPPHMLPMVYQSMAYQRLAAQQQARTEFGTQQGLQAQQRQAAAAAASQMVATGSGAVGTTTDRGDNGNMSLMDAINNALEPWDGVSPLSP